jgi:hypothetical protein
LLFLPWVATAESGIHKTSPVLSAFLHQNSARVGNVVVLTLNYRLPEGSRVTEVAKIDGLEGLTIVERETGPGQIIVKLLVDNLGPWKSRPLRLAYLDKEERIQTLKADPVWLKVISNLGENPTEAQLRNIHDIIPIEAVWPGYLTWGGGMLGVLLAGLGVLSSAYPSTKEN